MSLLLYYYTVPCFDGDGDDDGDAWTNRPSYVGLILYSIVTPLFCFIGLTGNAVSLLVLMRKELKGSVYVYLSVLSATDLCSSIILFLSGLSRGILWKHGWENYDALVGLPLSGVFNSLNVLATVFVTADRMTYMWNPCGCNKPNFCNFLVARKIMIVSGVIAVIINLPYCFVFQFAPESRLMVTDFFHSKFYAVYSWFIFILFGIVSSIFLAIGNGFLIYLLRKFRIANKVNRNRKRQQQHINLIVTLISIVVVFLVTEIPLLLASRSTIITYLFVGNNSQHQAVEILRQICAVTNAVTLALNFVLYYLFCPDFCRVLSRITAVTRRPSPARGRINSPPPQPQTVHFNVFFINEDGGCGGADGGPNNHRNRTMMMTDRKLYEMMEEDHQDRIKKGDDNNKNWGPRMGLYHIVNNRYYEKLFENLYT